MSEQPRNQAGGRSEVKGDVVTRSLLTPRSMTYSWGEVVVAAVNGVTATFFDGGPEPEVRAYSTPDDAHDAALRHAWSFEDARRAMAEAEQ